MSFGLDSHGRGSVKELRSRIVIAMALVVIAFIVLVVRLYTLQILRGEELSQRGQRNFVQHVEIRHDRGIIFDRNGEILVDNRPSLDLQVTPAFLGDDDEKEMTLQRLASHVGFTQSDIDGLRERIEQNSGLRRFKPLLIKRDLEPDQVERIEADRAMFLLDGVDIIEGRRRVYRYGSTASHILGYVNEIDARLLDRERSAGNPLGYRLGDLIGRDGVERTHEKVLRGVDGYEKVVVDAKGRRLRGEFIESLLGPDREVPAKPGNNVYLSLDVRLQQAAEDALRGFGVAGSVVALDANTGAVLAMVSLPEFDPNRIAGDDAASYKAELDRDPLKPWINRPIQGQYAPGSTFKAFTGFAALQQGVVTKTETIFAPGAFRLGRHTWRCHREAGHGNVDLKDALKVSCDVYFYTAAHRMGIDAIAEVAREFGFGSRTGIALQNEKTGIVPDEAWHDRIDKATGGYQRGMAINTSIGQGALLVTPLQLAVAYAAIANGGKVLVPQTVDRIETADMRVVRHFLPETRYLDRNTKELIANTSEEASMSLVNGGQVVEHVYGVPPTVIEEIEANVANAIDLDPEHLQAIREGLIAVAQEPGGTAYWRRSRQVTMAGKTGTAQVVRLGKHRLKAEEEDYFFRDHAWFASYAPAENPEIVVVCLNEHSGHGSSKAAPVAVAVIDKFFELNAELAAIAPTPEPYAPPPTPGPSPEESSPAPDAAGEPDSEANGEADAATDPDSPPGDGLESRGEGDAP